MGRVAPTRPSATDLDNVCPSHDTISSEFITLTH